MASEALGVPASDCAYCVVARRNDALGARGRWQVFGAIATVSCTLAVVFATLGAWPVLPYSVLEIGVLGAAFWWVGRAAGDWERLTVVGDRVTIERETRGTRRCEEFNRCWLRVEVGAAGWGTSPRLILHSAGRSCEFGAALPVAERLQVARELRRMSAYR